jgi:catechol 2,3-dioxygenase
MHATVRPCLTHAGIRVWDIDRMREFYCAALGLIVSDTGRGPVSGLDFVFMTAEADKHHQFVLTSGRPREERCTTVFQLSFRLATLAELRVVEARAREAGASRFVPMSHGNAWSVYFDDPEGNTIEVYVDSPWYVPQPFGDPLDLSQSDEEILRATEARCRACPGFAPAEAWRAEIGRRLAG